MIQFDDARLLPGKRLQKTLNFLTVVDAPLELILFRHVFSAIRQRGGPPLHQAAHDHSAEKASTASNSPLVRKVRKATAQYRDINAALAAGYAPATPCVSGPNAGAMGVHLINGALLGKEVDAETPEALIYERFGFGAAVDTATYEIDKRASAFRTRVDDQGSFQLVERDEARDIVADIYDLMKIPVVMMGYGLDSDGLHAPNEHYSIEMFHRGIETAIVYLEELASIPKGSAREHAISAR